MAGTPDGATVRTLDHQRLDHQPDDAGWGKPNPVSDTTNNAVWAIVGAIALFGVYTCWHWWREWMREKRRRRQEEERDRGCGH